MVAGRGQGRRCHPRPLSERIARRPSGVYDERTSPHLRFVRCMLGKVEPSCGAGTVLHYMKM